MFAFPCCMAGPGCQSATNVFSVNVWTGIYQSGSTRGEDFHENAGTPFTQPYPVWEDMLGQLSHNITLYGKRCWDNLHITLPFVVTYVGQFHITLPFVRTDAGTTFT